MIADQYGLFWNSDQGDRKYNAGSLEKWLRKFFTSGVFEGDLQVVEASGMNVHVRTGYSNLNGKVGIFEQENNIVLDAPSGTYGRYDAIMVERDDINRVIQLKYVKGTYAGDEPPYPTPTWSDQEGIYQLVLAYIYVGAGVSTITQANIYDKRPDSSVCGYITGTVFEMDFTQFVVQFESFYSQFVQTSNSEYAQWKSDRNDDYTAWTDEMRNGFLVWINDFKNDAHSWEDGFQTETEEWRTSFEAYVENWRSGMIADQAQWERGFESDSTAWRSSFQTALTNWYQQMQGQISQDAAVSLQTQINALKYFYVEDGIMYMPNTSARVDDGILIVGSV